MRCNNGWFLRGCRSATSATSSTGGATSTPSRHDLGRNAWLFQFLNNFDRISLSFGSLLFLLWRLLACTIVSCLDSATTIDNVNMSKLSI